MKKFCVFCGQKPSKKNKEHIIPKWLIQMTGDLNREILVGRDWANDTLESKIFRFSSYTFPACKSCNDHFGILERETKPVLLDIMNGNNVEESGLNKLLDWFDKIRTGLWLSDYVLNKNHNGIKPHYFISDRVGRSDRILIIYKNENEPKGISFIGTDGPVFQSMPSAFGLKINDYYFVSLSSPILLHKDMGLIYPKIHEVDSDTELSLYSFTEGDNKLSVPESIDKFPKRSIAIFQAIKFENINKDQSNEELYSTEHARDLFDSDINGRSRIFVSDGNDVGAVNGGTSIRLDNINSPVMFSLQLGLNVMEFQENLFKDSTSFDDVLGSEQERVSSYIEYVNKTHLALKNIYKTQMSQMFSELFTDLTRQSR